MGRRPLRRSQSDGGEHGVGHEEVVGASKVRGIGPSSSQGRAEGWRRSLRTGPGFWMILSDFVQAYRLEHSCEPPRKRGLVSSEEVGHERKLSKEEVWSRIISVSRDAS